MTDPKADFLISRFDRLKADRKVFESHWQECATYVLPMKDDVTKKSSAGDKHGLTILDNTAIQSNELLAGFLHGFLTNPSEKWFEYTTGDQALDEDDTVRLYLQQCENRTMNVLINSNFQTEVHELYLDLGCFGTAPMSIEEDDKMVVRFTSRPISQCVIDEDHRGEIDTVIREWNPSVRELHGLFGDEAMDDRMQKELADNPEKTYCVLHGLFPAEDYKRRGFKAKKALPFISLYVMREGKRVLREGGFNEFPWVAPRWSKLSGEKYGRCPAMVALPEAKLINKMAETVIKGAQKVVDPPLQLPSDGFILPINTRPGGLIFKMSGTAAGDDIKPILNDARIDFGDKVMEGVRKRIKDAFYQDELMLSNNLPQQTATEVQARMDQKNRFLGPLLGRQQNEFLRPMIDRVFSIMLRKGLFAEPPQKLQGKRIDVRYSSAIAQVQRANTAASIQRTVAACAPFMQMDPSVADLFDGEEATREIARVMGAPQRILRTREDIEGIRQARQQAQQQQAQVAQGAAVSDINLKDAKAKAALQAV